MLASRSRLRKHAEFQRVYRASRKHFAKHMSYFFLLRESALLEDCSSTRGPRVGLTVGKAMGKAVDRNRIKRRMREAVRSQLPSVSLAVDIVLHPRRDVEHLDFQLLQREVRSVFQSIQNAGPSLTRAGRL